MSEEAQPLTPSEAEEAREGQDHPGKVPGEGNGPSEAGSGGGGDDVDSAAIGDGPSGGAPSGSTGDAGSDAIGAGPSGGAE